MHLTTRRSFIGQSAAIGLMGAAPALALQDRKKAPEHALTVISGSPRERGRQYGKAFKDAILAFLEKEIYGSFTKKAPSRAEVLAYATACSRKVAAFSPTIQEELEGAAETTGLRVEELVLITLHEELWHRGVLPPIEKCTAIAAGPPDTSDGNTYVGQTWDWMESVYGLSSMLHWKRPEGPSLLSYGYPGLWAGAGMNSEGLALTWTSGDGLGIAGPRVGIPSYLLIAQMLYQKTLKDAVEEARRAGHAGWFTFVLGDAQGNLANVEGTPKELAVEFGRGHLTRVLFGSRQIKKTPEGEKVKVHPRCDRVCALLCREKGKIDRAALQKMMGDHGESGADRVCQHYGTIDAMLFNLSRREAHLIRGPVCQGPWKTFRFDDK